MPHNCSAQDFQVRNESTVLVWSAQVRMTRIYHSQLASSLFRLDCIFCSITSTNLPGFHLKSLLLSTIFTLFFLYSSQKKDIIYTIATTDMTEIDTSSEFYPEPFSSGLPVTDLARISMAKLFDGDKEESAFLFDIFKDKGFCFLDKQIQLVNSESVRDRKTGSYSSRSGVVLCAVGESGRSLP